MDLWIRSWDREMLSKVDCVDVMHNDGYASIFINGKFPDLIVGAYENDRAIEILDEIQNLLQPRFVVNNSPTDDELCDMYAKENVFKVMPKDRVDINCIQANCIVYEMPKE